MLRPILVINPSERDRSEIKDAVSNSYEVIEVFNTEDAVPALNSNYKLLAAVVVDLDLPNNGAIKILTLIKKNPVLLQIPVLVTGDSTALEPVVIGLGAQCVVTRGKYHSELRLRLANLINLREFAALTNSLRKDQLTGLLTRSNFLSSVEKRIWMQKPGYYGMCAFDIDKFSILNDQYGSQKGDEILKLVADTVRSMMDTVGGLCCRISADNFAMLYPVETFDVRTTIKQRLVNAFVQASMPPITFSIGAYVVDDLFLPAAAMYDRALMAKDSVKGQFEEKVAVYDESMRETMLNTQRINDEMKPALVAGQFEAWFQPQYSISTGKLVGAEALVRWRHPSRGMISPAEFIPVFEKNGFIYELDKYMWEQTCIFLKKHIDMGEPLLPISVNVSRYDILCPDLIAVLMGLVEKYELPRNALRLEVTESAFADDGNGIINVVTQLVQLGFLVEIDDFGSGYSSLNTLKDVPAQIVKLDMRFLEGSNNLERGGSIIESIIRMTKWLDIAVIAEGVETEQQAAFLHSIGCEFAQGYFYARPMPMDDYAALIAQDLGNLQYSDIDNIKAVEHFDNNAFWDPSSLDSLIFNSFVGASCILELEGERLTTLRSTEAHGKMWENLGLARDVMMKINWSDHIDKSQLGAFKDAIRTCAKTKKSIISEYSFKNLPGCKKMVYLRGNQRVIASTGDRYMIYCINEDITAQREAEMKKDAAEKKLSAMSKKINLIMNSVGSSICASTCDASGKVRVVFSNDAYNDMFGCAAANVRKGLDPASVVIEEDRVKTVKAIQAVRDTKIPATLTFRCRMANGELCYIRGQYSVIEMSDVRGDVLLSVCTNITEEVKLAKRETAVNRQSQAMMLNFDGGISITKFENNRIKYLYANDKYYQLFGYTKEQFHGELSDGFLDLLSKDEAQRVVRLLAVAENNNKSAEYEFNAAKRDGSRVTVHCNTSIYDNPDGGTPIRIAMFTDVTEQRNIKRKLEDSDQLFRTASTMAGVSIGRLDLTTNTFTHNDKTLLSFGMPAVIHNASESYVQSGFLSPESIPAFHGFMARIKDGAEFCTVDVRMQSTDKKYRWIRIQSSSVFDKQHQPLQAIFVASDITESREKEAIYTKWKQGLTENPTDTYSLIRCSVGEHSTLVKSVEGTLLNAAFEKIRTADFDSFTKEYVNKYVYPDDRTALLEMLSHKFMEFAHSKGMHKKTIEFRESQKGDTGRWLRLTGELVEYPHSSEIEAYLMFENIDNQKKEDLLVRKQAELDWLTGISNRATFISQFEEQCANSPADYKCGFILLDLDDFKSLNDTCGHLAGDKALIDTAKAIRAALRPCDLLGRLGGDEFLVCVCGVEELSEVSAVAEAIRAAIRHISRNESNMSASVGIAMYPDDGKDFKTLYHKADTALYAVKGVGKDDFAFYHNDMQDKE